jgi:hypothetical protein
MAKVRTPDADRIEREARAERLVLARRAAGYRGAVSAARHFNWPVDAYKAHEAGRNGFGNSDARKYARAFEVSLSWLTLNEGPMKGDEATQEGAGPTGGLPVLGEVAAGNWMEPEELDEPRGNLFVPPDPRYPLRYQRVYVVKGRSVERTASEGQALICVATGNGSPIEPQNGDLVIAERIRAQGGLIERTAKRLRLTRSVQELVPEYLDEKLNEPIALAPPGTAADDIEVRIAAVVVSVYRPLRS